MVGGGMGTSQTLGCSAEAARKAEAGHGGGGQVHWFSPGKQCFLPVLQAVSVPCSSLSTLSSPSFRMMREFPIMEIVHFTLGMF